MKLDTYIMPTDPISTVYFINSSHQSVCLYMSLQGNGSVKFIPPFNVRQRLGKHVPRATNSHNGKRIVGRLTFYTVRVLTKESLWVSLCILLSLLGTDSVKTFPRQQRIFGGVVFYALLVVSKESRRLVLPDVPAYFFCIGNYS
jgi:hypothetical protein